MSAVLKFPSGEVVDHSSGAAQAMNLIAGFRAHAGFSPGRCEDCGRPSCTKRQHLQEMRALREGNAPADMVAMTDAAYMLSLAECQANARPRVMSMEDIELDSDGYIKLDATDYADRIYDLWKEGRL